MNKSKDTTNYVVQRIIGGAVTIAITVICGRITILHHRKERQERRKDKAKDYDLRNQKAVELKRMISAIDKNPLPGDTTIQTPKTFDQMTSRPMAEESGWLLPWYAKRGQISGCVAGADLGKTILMIDSALAAAKGERPTFLPEGAPKADKMDVV